MNASSKRYLEEQLKILDRIKKNDSIEELIKSNDFVRLLVNSNTEAEKYLLKKFNDFIYSLVTGKIDPSSLKNCRILLNNISQKKCELNEKYFEAFVNYSQNFSKYKDIKPATFFSLLKNYVTFKDNHAIVESLNFKEFSQYLHVKECMFLYNTIIVSFPKKYSSVLKEKMMIDSIFDALVRKDASYDNCQSLIIIASGKFLSSEVVRKILEDDASLLKFLISNISESPRNMDILNALIHSEHSYFFSGDWNEFILRVDAHIDTFYDFVSGSELFTKSTEYGVRLIISMINATGNNYKFTKDLLINLVELFFKFRTNSFLHNCTYTYIAVLRQKNHISSEMISQSNLHVKILECYEQTNKNIKASYWSQLRLISQIIAPYVYDIEGFDVKKWKSLVMEKNKVDLKIISKPFGGKAVKLSAGKYPSSFSVPFVVFIIFFLIMFICFKPNKKSPDDFI